MSSLTANTFRFKQFSVAQNDQVFKLGTDACLLGALAEVESAKSILDVGTGTGVIALMLAQRNQLASIDAIDLNRDAIELATLNFENSPWSNRLEAYHSSLDVFHLDDQTKYDLIVSNPPFFRDSIPSNLGVQKLARHESTLNLSSLSIASKRLLSDHGSVNLVLPIDRFDECLELFRSVSLHASNIYFIKPFERTAPNRFIAQFKKKFGELRHLKVTIYKSQNQFTPQFTRLLSPFYLHL